MKKSSLGHIASLIIIGFGISLFADQAQAGWMASSDFTSCPSHIKATYGSEGPFNSESECLARVRQVQSSQNMSCVRYACTLQGGTSGSSGGASSPQAGHEMDQHIGDAISAGMSGQISPTDAVGLASMGLIGNALLAPSTPAQPKTPAQLEAERVAYQKAAIESARQEREREERKDARVEPMLALLEPVPSTPAQEPSKSLAFTKGFEHASQCISQNAGTACSGATANEQEACVAEYRAGYDAGNRPKKMTLEEALQAGLAAGKTGGLANGASDARAVGPCRIEWIESYNRGYFQGKNGKSGK